jgi:hypothetical protein
MCAVEGPHGQRFDVGSQVPRTSGGSGTHTSTNHINSSSAFSFPSAGTHPMPRWTIGTCRTEVWVMLPPAAPATLSNTTITHPAPSLQTALCRATPGDEPLRHPAAAGTSRWEAHRDCVSERPALKCLLNYLYPTRRVFTARYTWKRFWDHIRLRQVPKP